MEKELEYLKGAMDSPSRPFIAMIGGAKVSTKVRQGRVVLSSWCEA